MASAGSIEERSPGVWRIRVSAGVDLVTGQRRVIRRTVKGTRQDAELARARILTERGSGDLGTNATVSTLLDTWLPKARLADSTRAGYRVVIRAHIRPRIGDIPLHRLTTFVVDQFYADLEAAGMSPIRIRKVHTVLRAALRRAVKWQWITANPCINAEPPTVHLKEAVAPSPDVVRALFEAAKRRGDMWYVMLNVAADLGCRRAELCGLKWDDIDFAAGTIQVRRAVDVINRREVIKNVKNEQRRGPEPITAEVVQLLRLWKLATPAHPDGWVFVSKRARSFYRPSGLSTMFRSLCNEVGVGPEIKLHGLRHYVGTYMRDEGVDIDVISRRLGHSRTSTTVDVYGHKVDGRARDAAERLGAITRGV